MPITINVGQQQSVGVKVGDVEFIKGDDGISPVIETEEITGGTRLIITDAEGTKQVDVMDGAPGRDGVDGQDGAPGRDGVDGASAGFGAPTATVDANVGTPSVEITASGPDTAKVFSFAFHNLKGESSGGSSDYGDLSNKPSIEGVTLSGNKTASDLGLAKASDIPAVPVQSVNGKTGAVVLGASDVGALPDSTSIPSKTSDLTNDSGYVNAAGAAAAAPVQSVNGNTGAVTVSVPIAYTSNPAMDGTASPGSSGSWARGDHVHPADINKQDKITASGLLKGDGSGGVSAAAAGTDYLTPATNYSPVFRLSPGASHAITSADSGKTFVDSYSSTASTLDILLTLSQADSSAFPVGAEIALTRIYSKSTKLTVSGVRLFNVDNGIIGSANGTATIQIAQRGMAAIKKIESNTATYGDVWLLTGNVEVVT